MILSLTVQNSITRKRDEIILCLYHGEQAADLIKRVWEHKNKLKAARREKRFKNWCRQWKLNLIEDLNPEWRDLYGEICS